MSESSLISQVLYLCCNNYTNASPIIHNNMDVDDVNGTNSTIFEFFDTVCQKVITVDNNVRTLYQYSTLR